MRAMRTRARWEMADNKNKIIFIVSHFLSLPNIKTDFSHLTRVIKKAPVEMGRVLQLFSVHIKIIWHWKFELTDSRHTRRHASNQQVIDLRYRKLFVLIIIKMSELLCPSTLYCVYFFLLSLCEMCRLPLTWWREAFTRKKNKMNLQDDDIEAKACGEE